METSDDGDQFLWETIRALEDLPQCSSVDRVIRLLKVNETHVQWTAVLMGFLHHDTKREQLVSTSTSLSEATLTFTKLELNTRLNMVEDGSADDLAWYAEQ